MSQHLSSEQLDSILNGQPSEVAALHLRGCTRCDEELASLGAAFGDLRASATGVAEHHRRFVAASSGGRRLPGMAWALAVAVLFVSVGAPLAVHRHVAPAGAGTASPGVAAMSDEALLSSVQDDLSSSVPEPLLPLAGPATKATDSTQVQQKN